MQLPTLLLVIVTVLQFLSAVYSAKDATLEPNTSGRDVVNAVLYKIQRAAIFPEDRRLLVRIGYVESKFGTDPNTYRPGYYGGIWQVDKVGFEDTQNVASHSSLSLKIQEIEKQFGIKWLEVKWEDLVKPYSGLAARLFLSNIQEAVPDSIQSQADYWKKYYNTKDGSGTKEKFIEDVHALEGQTICNARIDIVVALDGSGSVDSEDFVTGKEGVVELLTRFSLETTNFGYIVFSNSANVIFLLQTFSSTSSLELRILDAFQPNGGTQTDLAINEAVMMLTKKTNEESRVKVLTVFTDGNSNNGFLTRNAADKAYEAGITTFSIGIGNGIDQAELLVIAANKTNHVFSVNSFDTLVELVYGLNSEACSIPQKPSLNETVTDTVSKDETRYFTYPFQKKVSLS